ncbi:MAG: CoA pyrophosphatase [Bacteroidota bacterium]
MQFSASLPANLRQRLLQPLPGLDAHVHMMPPIRDRIVKIPDNARLSAVLLLLYPQDGQWFMPLMRRSQDGRVHGGQISFPGGRREKSDPDFTFTALREAEEEMAIPAAEVEVLGDLSQIYIPPSNSVVHPRLGFLPQRPDFVPHPVEVDEIIEIDIAQMLDDSRQGRHEVDVFAGNMINAPGYTFDEDLLVWGGTAMILAEFAQLLQEVITGK